MPESETSEEPEKWDWELFGRQLAEHHLVEKSVVGAVDEKAESGLNDFLKHTVGVDFDGLTARDCRHLVESLNGYILSSEFPKRLGDDQERIKLLSSHFQHILDLAGEHAPEFLQGRMTVAELMELDTSQQL